MAGLDAVKGPHWSQILALYGPGGTLSEALRDRTQVQLKDKARNLKLFFLKSKIEVPYYLGFVTGELKSRAPSHVAAEGEGNDANAENGDRIVPNMHDFDPPSPTDEPVQSTESQPTPTPALTVPPQDSTYASPYAVVGADQRPQELSVPPRNISIHSNNIDNIDPAINEKSKTPANDTHMLPTTVIEESIAVTGSNGMTDQNRQQPSSSAELARPTIVAIGAPITNGEQPQKQDSTKATSPAISNSDPSAQQLQAEQETRSKTQFEDANGGSDAPSVNSGWQAVNA